MTSLGGKLTALGCHPTKRVINIAEELTYLSINIAQEQITLNLSGLNVMKTLYGCYFKTFIIS
jgi:hypothetical protein